MPTIAEWMESQGVGQYAALFAQHEVGLDVLPELTDHDLEKLGLPVATEGERRQLTVCSATCWALPSWPTGSIPKYCILRELE